MNSFEFLKGFKPYKQKPKREDNLSDSSKFA